MDNQSFIKISKTGKEIKELVSDRDRLLQLCERGNVDEINSYIDGIIRKYPLETTIYHTTHFMPSTNLQERVQSCTNFLNGLILAKKTELASESSKEIYNA